MKNNNDNSALNKPAVSCSFSDEELKKKAVEFYEFWYDKYGTSEIDEIERKAVIHAFLGGCRFVLENCN